MTDTIAAAHGRWREILAALGVAAHFLTGKHQPCPLCGGKDRFRFTDRQGDGDYYCNQCGAGKGVQFVMKLHGGWDFSRAASEIDKIIGNLPPMTSQANGGDRPVNSTDELNLIWRVAQPIKADDPAGAYLLGRKIDIAAVDIRALRITTMPHRSGGVHPCMIACMCDTHGKARQIHRTYLTNEGAKADVEPNRMFMPGGLPGGGAIRLGRIAETMGVAEGIETALSAAILHSVPVWATTSENLLLQWKPPTMVKRVVIFGDRDRSYTGQAASFMLAKRLVMEAKRDKIERDVSVMLAPKMGQDWNDVLVECSERRIAAEPVA